MKIKYKVRNGCEGEDDLLYLKRFVNGTSYNHSILVYTSGKANCRAAMPGGRNCIRRRVYFRIKKTNMFNDSYLDLCLWIAPKLIDVKFYKLVN